MSGLFFGLVEKTMSADLKLSIQKEDNGAIFFCIYGDYNGERVQFDFDEITAEEAEDLASYIRMETRKPLSAQAQE